MVYAYFLYPVVLFAMYSAAQIKRDLSYLSGRHDRRAHSRHGEALPRVSIVMPAYNEAKYLEQTIWNLANVDYPAQSLEAVIASDGSTDGTNEILQKIAWPEMKPLFLERQGKAGTLNRAVQHASGDILVLCDASTQLAADAVHKLVRHFRDPRVGVVCGSLDFIRSAESEHTEGI
ncbi:MAG: glycosyltransferase, partial [Candidatus Acidiferrales bacterium]